MDPHHHLGRHQKTIQVIWSREGKTFDLLTVSWLWLRKPLSKAPECLSWLQKAYILPNSLSWAPDHNPPQCCLVTQCRYPSLQSQGPCLSVGLPTENVIWWEEQKPRMDVVFSPAHHPPQSGHNKGWCLPFGLTSVQRWANFPCDWNMVSRSTHVLSGASSRGVCP